MPPINTRADSLHVAFVTGDIPPATPRMMPCIGTIPGVILQGGIGPSAELGASQRNGPGRGRLSSEGDGTRLRWRAPGSLIPGPVCEIHGDGYYLVEDGEDGGKFIRARVVAAYLLNGPTMEPVYIQRVVGRAIEAITPDPVDPAVVDTTFIVENQSPGTISRIRAWIDPDTDYCEIAPDGGGFSSPTSEAAAILLAARLTAGQSATGTLRRTIPAATAANPAERVGLHFAFDGV